MSVLIKGMTMPLDCTECQLYTDGARCGITNTIVDLMEEYGQRNDNCPLVEIETPHGRLIDESIVLENIRKSLGIADLSFLYNAEKSVVNEIYHAPTVIEEE